MSLVPRGSSVQCDGAAEGVRDLAARQRSMQGEQLALERHAARRAAGPSDG